MVTDRFQGTTTYIGPPGTGKTTTLGNIVCDAVDAGRKPMVCSLTRNAAAEVVRRRLPVPSDSIGTLHSHAFAALDRPQMVGGRLDEWNDAEPQYAVSTKGSASVDDPYTERATDTLGDQLSAQLDLLRHQCRPRELWPEAVTAFATRWQAWKDDGDLLDFTDLIDRAHREIPVAPGGPDLLMVDEAQDMSRLELDLLRKWAIQAHGLTIVGDPWQALYCWRGAAPEMFSSPLVHADRRHVLSQSYRIPEAVHGAAIAWVRGLSDYAPIEYAARDDPGKVARVQFSFRAAEEVLRLASSHLAQDQTVMICASCSYLLNPCLAALRQAGTPFANPWRKRRGDWNPLQPSNGVSMSQRLLAFLRPHGGVFGGEDDFAFGGNRSDPNATGARSWTIGELAAWVDAINSRGVLRTGAKGEITELAKGESSLSARCVNVNDIDQWFVTEQQPFVSALLEDRIGPDESLRWYEEHLTSAKKKAAVFPLRVLRSSDGPSDLTERPRLYIGTIHSFKGAQADVVIVCPDLSLSGMREWVTHGAGRDSVIRLFYVALTRARQCVYLCMPASARATSVWEYGN